MRNKDIYVDISLKAETGRSRAIITTHYNGMNRYSVFSSGKISILYDEYLTISGEERKILNVVGIPETTSIAAEVPKEVPVSKPIKQKPSFKFKK